MKKIVIFMSVVALGLMMVPKDASGAELNMGFKYTGVANKTSNLTFSRGVMTGVNVLTLKKDATGVPTFKLVEEFGYTQIVNKGVEEQILTMMTYGMVPVWNTVWLGFGTGFYNFVMPGEEDVKAPTVGLKGTATWKGYRLGLGAEALQMAGSDSYFFGFDLTRSL